MSEGHWVRLRAIAHRPGVVGLGSGDIVEKRWVLETADGRGMGFGPFESTLQAEEVIRHNGWRVGNVIDESSSPDWKHRSW